jgi:uncharacterized protein
MGFLDRFKRPLPPAPTHRGVFSTDGDPRAMDAIIRAEMEKREEIFARFTSAPKFKALDSAGKEVEAKTPTFAMDANNGQGGDSVKWAQNINNALPFAQLSWYANQTFAGYQACALMAQNWLINKCCTIAPRDALRRGYEITVNNGQRADPALLAKIKIFDKKYGIRKNILQYVRYGLIFGIRVAWPLIDGMKDEDLAKPFNPDIVKKGSYRGITQIDPYWITPELNFEAGSDPASMHFYEPTWWRVNGKRVHRTHLIIYRPFDVADILKPVYWYGGIPLPQLIAERVYAAERVANEAPMLSLSKRTLLIHTDAAQALANQQKFDERMQLMATMRNNYGAQILDREDTAEQFDTSLTDFDQLIMTQYQLVAAAAEYPATKLLETSPKGFDATGEFEADNYHERLESMQAHDMEPLLDRHYLLASRSEGWGVDIDVNWNPVDTPTGKELAEINFLKSQTAANEAQIGAIDGIDERNRLTTDAGSGYNGLEEREPELPTDVEEADQEGPEAGEE